MTPDEMRSVLEFDRNLKLGDTVQLRWTNSGRFFAEAGTVVKLNAKSVRAKLTAAVPGASDWPGSGYPAGFDISVPRVLAFERWSYNNGAFPALQPETMP